MNKFYIFFLALTVVSFIACDDDGDGNIGNTNDGIAGTWDLNDVSLSGSTVVEINGESVTTSVTGTGIDYNTQITFTGNPNQYTATGTFGMEMSFNQGGVTFESEYVDEELAGTGTWTMVDDMLTVNEDEDDPITFDILELSTSELRLRFEETEVEVDGDATTTTEITGEYRFTR